MQINHNINAMITQHALRNNNNAMGKSLEKLSTGLRINRAQDDAAGLAMSEQMRTQIRGLGKAKQNSQDGIAALQIAEGGLAEIGNIMQRQRELAIQAANDTLTSTERKYLDLEFQELTKEIARIAKTTDYNGKNMLNWSEDPNLSFAALGDKHELRNEIFNELEKLDELVGKMSDVTGPPIAPTDVKAQIQYAISMLRAIYDIGPDDHASQSIRAYDDNTFGVLDRPIEIGTNPGELDLPDMYYAAGAVIDPDDPLTFPGAGIDPSVYPDVGEYEPGSLMHMLNKLIEDINLDDDTNDLATVKDKELAAALKERLNIIVNGHSEPNTDSLLFLYSNMLENDMTNAASYTLHIGPNYSTGMGGKWANEMTITYFSLNPGSLGISTKNIKTQNNSTETIDHLDKIIKSVSGVRAKIGTYINRLEYTINNISSLEFNTQDAESRIRDTDFASSTTEFTRNQILVQSATSMLAQANSLPSTALSLING